MPTIHIVPFNLAFIVFADLRRFLLFVLTSILIFLADSISEALVTLFLGGPKAFQQGLCAWTGNPSDSRKTIAIGSLSLISRPPAEVS